MRLSLSFLRAALPEALFFVCRTGLLASACDDDEWAYKDQEIGVAFDSRVLSDGELFVALCGATVNGHAFIQEVLKKKASAILVSDQSFLQAVPVELWQSNLVVVVRDTAAALVSLARAWRKSLTIPVVGITGSVGKTTTKEMIRSILKAGNINALVSEKNQNTVIGIAATILNTKLSHQVLVCEVGISLKGEMAERIEILRPSIALITNVGHAHVKGLGGVEGVAFEKRQIFKFFEPNHIGIINGDQFLLDTAYYHHPVARFGFKTKNQIQARKVTTSVDANGCLAISFTLKWYGKKAAVRLAAGHQGYVTNALAASAVAYFLHLPFDTVVQGLTAYEGFAGRFESHAIAGGRGTLISDCYNANPESMRAAIEAFGKMAVPGKKIAVIGDMLELGDKEIFWNRQVGRMLAKAGAIDEVILVGPLAAAAKDVLTMGTKAVAVQTWQDAVPLVQEALGDKAFVLVKGSRGVGLKNLVERFT